MRIVLFLLLSLPCFIQYSEAYPPKPKHVTKRRSLPSVQEDVRYDPYYSADEYHDDFEDRLLLDVRRNTQQQQQQQQPGWIDAAEEREPPLSKILEELQRLRSQLFKRMDLMEERIAEIKQFQDDLSVVVVNQTSFLSKLHQMVRVAVHDQISFRGVVGNLTESVYRNLITTTLIKSYFEEKDFAQRDRITTTRGWNGERKGESAKPSQQQPNDEWRFKNEVGSPENVVEKTEHLANEVEQCGQELLSDIEGFVPEHDAKSGIEELAQATRKMGETVPQQYERPSGNRQDTVRRIHEEVMKTGVPYSVGNRKTVDQGKK